MIRMARRPRSAAVAWHAGFLAMLPAIRTHARIAFRHLAPEARQEAVQEAVCNAGETAPLAWLVARFTGRADRLEGVVFPIDLVQLAAIPAVFTRPKAW